MRIVDAAEIKRVLTFPVLVDALEAAHQRPKIDIADSFLGGEKELYFTRHAVDRGRFMASKLITSFPSNLAQGRFPAVQAVFVIFDGTNASLWRSSTARKSPIGAPPPVPRWREAARAA